MQTNRHSALQFCILISAFCICSQSPQLEPIKLVRPHRQQIGEIADSREHILAEHLYENVSFEWFQIQFNRLGRTRKIVHHENRLAAQLSDVCQHPVISRKKELY